MHDIKFIRQNPEAFDAGLKRRGLAPMAAKILCKDEEVRAHKTELQTLESQLNQLNKAIGIAKSKKEDVSDLMKKVEIAKLDLAIKGGNTNLEIIELETIPNLPAADVPEGMDEHGNKEVRVVGTKPTLSFAPKLHDDLGVALKLMDFDAAAKLSGARFVVLKGALARMERALASFMLDIHTQQFGYNEMVTPALVHEKAAFGTGNLPKFADQLFKTTEGFYLIPTAEMTLTNLVADAILDEESLPLRMTAYTPCFRSEAGAAGKDTRGMIRQHQFSKVELVSIVHPDKSEEEHERMTSAAEEILKRLELHYRVMLLCSGDMGFSARKTYDIEVWLPGQNTFREISSCSNCGDFQARRMKARFKGKNSKETQFVHTLNGSGLAIGRTMVAILENYQKADGSIIVPEALKPYMGGLEKIVAA